MNDLMQFYKKLQQQPQSNSGIIDRYFLNHYTIAIIQCMNFATEAPGFTIDTPVEQ